MRPSVRFGPKPSPDVRNVGSAAAEVEHGHRRRYLCEDRCDCFRGRRGGEPFEESPVIRRGLGARCRPRAAEADFWVGGRLAPETHRR